jgi:hypothetical protein
MLCGISSPQYGRGATGSTSVASHESFPFNVGPVRSICPVVFFMLSHANCREERAGPVSRFLCTGAQDHLMQQVANQSHPVMLNRLFTNRKESNIMHAARQLLNQGRR